MNLADLPLELLELVAESIERESDVNSLVRASRGLHHCLTPHLYYRGTLGRGSNPRSSALRWAATRGRPDTLRRATTAGVKLGDDPQLLSFAASHAGGPTITIIVDAGGFDVNAPGKRKLAALLWAVSRMDFSLAEYLLNSLWADPDVTDPEGLTPLHLLAGTGPPRRADMAKLLFENCARVDLLSVDGETPLHLAAKNGDCEMAELLLKHGADPAQEGFYNVAPVHAAVSSQSRGVLELLLGAWGDASLSSLSQSVLDLAACTYGNHEMVDLILGSGAGVCGQWETYKAMCSCVERGLIECVQVFLKHGVTRPEVVPDGSVRTHETPLSAAAEGWTDKRSKIMRLLLRAGFGLPDASPDRGRLLLTAAEDGDPEVVAMLLERGADPMVVDFAGETPAHEAARLGHTDVVRLLQGAPGCDITAPSSTGRTPFFHAAMRGFYRVIDALVGETPAGASLPGNRRDVYGTSPVVAAARNGCRGTVAGLLALDPGSAGDVDREGRGIAWWLEKCGREPLPELAADGAGTHDWELRKAVPGQDEISDGGCWCDVCTRSTAYPGAPPAKYCAVCYGEDEEFVICQECEGFEGPYCDASHEKFPLV